MIYCCNCRYRKDWYVLPSTCLANPVYTTAHNTWYQHLPSQPQYMLCATKNRYNNCPDYQPNWQTRIKQWAERMMNKWMA